VEPAAREQRLHGERPVLNGGGELELVEFPVLGAKLSELPGAPRGA
jgi:hypothetical protein